MNIAKWLERSAVTYAKRPALMLGLKVQANYSEFHNKAASFANWIKTQGIKPNDRVAIFMKNCPDYLICLYGIWIAGAVAVPINAKLHPKEALWIIDDSGAKLCLVSTDQSSELKTKIILDVSSDVFSKACTSDKMATVSKNATDLAWLFYTSGTTGRPKGVEITHGMLVTMSLSYISDVDEVKVSDAALYAAPMSHGAGLYALVHVLQGAAHICPLSGGFDPDEILSIAKQHGSLSMFMAPTMVQRLTHVAKKSNSRGEGIRTIVYGGGPMYQSDLKEALDWFGPKFVQIYGQGECPMAITALSRSDISDTDNPDWEQRIHSVGKAQAAVEVAIGDAQGNFLNSGDIGEIMVRGAPVMPRYWNNPSATEEALKNGWLFTGDVGFIDQNGYVTLKDRSKDVIISGGTNIYPNEVEQALLSHHSVLEVSVIGRPSAEWGEDVIAFVVLKPDNSVNTSALDLHCISEIARFKRPKKYIFLDKLPKNNYGKILKTRLRDQV